MKSRRRATGLNHYLQACFQTTRIHALLLLKSAERIGRLPRNPATPDKLGPCVGEHEVLDTLLCLVEDGLIEVIRNLAPVLYAVLKRAGHHGGLHGLLGAIGRVGRARFIEGCDLVDLALVAVQDARGALEDGLKLLERLRGDVDGEFCVADTDELCVDVQGAVEAFADQLLDVVAGALGQGVLPLGDAGEEGDIFGGEVLEGGEFEEGRGVAFEDVLQGAHGEDAVVGAVGLDGAVGGFPARHHRVDHCGYGVEGFGFGAGGLGLILPLCDCVERFFKEGLVAHNLPAGQEDSEDFHEPNRKANPMITTLAFLKGKQS